MARQRLIWQIYPPFVLIIVIALSSVTWVFTQTIDFFYTHELQNDLAARIQLLTSQTKGFFTNEDSDYLDRLSKELGEKTGTRFTLVLSNGHVLADTKEDPASMDNHAKRPEIFSALQGDTGVSQRFSNTLQQNMMYVALPVTVQGNIIGCIRAAIPMKTMTQTLESAFYPAIYTTLAVALLATLISLWLSRRISKPLEEMKSVAERFAAGDLNGRLPAFSGEEMGALADAMNQMAAQLDDRIRTIIRQRNEQDAVLSSMIEGVIAVDKNEKVLRINKSAAKLLSIDTTEAIGRLIQEIVRKPELQNFIARALSSHNPIEADIKLMIRGKELYLQVHGSPLQDAMGKDIGALIVFNDITNLQRLESIRRDFVANVSHELKTPITAIKSAAETLQNGLLNDSNNKERFLEIITRQSDRLNAIIEDLLTLSRIEQGEMQQGDIKFEFAYLRPVFLHALQSCQIKALDKSIALEMECPKNLKAKVSVPLLEQALVNLIDNAIKYSPESGRIFFSAQQDKQTIIIKVQDWGCGIPEEHLPRLFERFYRVDKARSRKLGGTGLGLAIVKHIVQCHNGQINVQSKKGQGSTFFITLPAAF